MMGVGLDTVKQIESQLQQRNYEGSCADATRPMLIGRGSGVRTPQRGLDRKTGSGPRRRGHPSVRRPETHGACLRRGCRWSADGNGTCVVASPIGLSRSTVGQQRGRGRYRTRVDRRRRHWSLTCAHVVPPSSAGIADGPESIAHNPEVVGSNPTPLPTSVQVRGMITDLGSHAFCVLVNERSSSSLPNR
jgi:hypothetical protein